MPIATDIAFALAVLAVLSTHLPSALRIFLLTLAVVDDLLAITVIAVFYTEHLSPGPLALALIPIGLFGVAVQRGLRQWWILLPLAVVAWALVHASGVHATVAGVLLGFTIPALGRHAAAERFEHRLQPVSAGFAVPVFAFFAAGVTVGGLSGFASALSHPLTIGVIAGLVLGKPIGVLVTTYLLARFTHATLDEDLAWRDVLGVALLAGIGFTVSLLIGELAFGDSAVADDDVNIRGAQRVGDCRSACRAGLGVAQRGIPPHPRLGKPLTTITMGCRTSINLDRTEREMVRTLTECLNRSAAPQICST